MLSSQPFVSYQVEVFKNVFLSRHEARFTFKGVGPAASKKYKNTPQAVAVLLDNLARLLYEEGKKQRNSS